MIAYADSDVSRTHLTRLEIAHTNSIYDFEHYPGAKVAVCAIPYPYAGWRGKDFEHSIDKMLEFSDIIIILGAELHEFTVDFCLRYQHPKIKYFICGSINSLNTIPWMDWFITSTVFYKNNLWVLDQLNPYQNKPKTFDALLGRPRYHRDVIYNFVKDHGFVDQTVLTYLQEDQAIQTQGTDNWIWEDTGLDLPKVNINWTVTPVKYHGHYMSLSQIIPISIYNQTAYSVVCETNFFNHFNFYTEKIVKPILAERLFLAVAGKHYLKNLRSLGFKTFDGIIDETYDTIEDDSLRFKMVCEQMQYLYSQPQEEILAKVRPITEHNRRVMLETDWYKNFTRELQAVLPVQQEQN
jgi:hypothetical protein